MLRYVKNGMLLLSVAYIVIGMLLLIMPETSLLWICNIFGVVVLVTGIVCLIQYARIRGTGFTAPFMLVGGVITAGLGIFTLAKPQVVTSFLPIVFGIFIVVDGLSRIGTAIDLAKRKGQKWWLLLLFRAELDIDQKPELRPYHREEVLCLNTTYPVGSMLVAPEFSRISGPALLRDWIGGLFRKRRHRGKGNFRLFCAGARLRQ